MRYAPVKRALDLALTVPAFVASLPVQAAAAVAIRTTMGSPVFFRQQRPGLNGEPFEMLKFRTMHRVDEDSGATGAHKSWRITAVGRILRRTRIDELPQLFNVLNGDMSLVGPRPMMVEQQSMYPGTDYFLLKPGLTGLWQVSERNGTTFAARAGYDAEYNRVLSLATDLQTIRQTATVVMRGTGI